MSVEDPTANEELVRRVLGLFNARDAEGIVALMDPDGELFPYAIGERRHDGYRGHEGLRQYVADVGAMFEDFEVALDDVRDVGDGVVLAAGRLRGHTRDGVELDMAVAWLWTCAEGKVLRMQAHPAGAPQ